MKTVTFRYGTGCGLIIILYSILSFWSFGDISKLSQQQFRLFELLGYLRYMLLIVTVYLVLRQSRKDAAGTLSFRSLLKEGVKVSLIIAVIVGVMEMTVVILMPDLYDTFGAIYLEQMKASGSTAEEINMARDQMANNNFLKAPWANGLFYFFETAFIGNIASLAFAAIMKPRPNA